MDQPSVSSGWIHYFDERLAVEYGLDEAIVYEKIKQWIRHNMAVGQNEESGKTWSYNTQEGWQKELPFLTLKRVRTALEVLRDKGLIIAEHRAKKRLDQTLWYALGNDKEYMNRPQGKWIRP